MARERTAAQLMETPTALAGSHDAEGINVDWSNWNQLSFVDVLGPPHDPGAVALDCE
jgi:hypothetical protein